MTPLEWAEELYRDVDVRDGKERWLRCVAAAFALATEAARQEERETYVQITAGWLNGAPLADVRAAFNRLRSEAVSR